jgi:hypothetical protein
VCGYKHSAFSPSTFFLQTDAGERGTFCLTLVSNEECRLVASWWLEYSFSFPVWHSNLECLTWKSNALR